VSYGFSCQEEYDAYMSAQAEAEAHAEAMAHEADAKESEFECPKCGSRQEPRTYKSNGSDGITKSIECVECGYEMGW
jgi:predicted RNA-binding Zn-ribbon protein involved in translation (DUF1610 family)